MGEKKFATESRAIAVSPTEIKLPNGEIIGVHEFDMVASVADSKGNPDDLREYVTKTPQTGIHATRDLKVAFLKNGK